MPDSTFGRLVVLLAATLMSTLLIAGLTLRSISIEPGGEQMADLLAGQILAARLLQADPAIQPQAGGEAVLDILRADRMPDSARRPWLPFLRRLTERLEQRLGEGSLVLIEDANPPRLWVGRREPDSPAIGIAVPHFVAQAAVLAATVAISALLLVLLAAGLFARSLARPLVRLAQAAPLLADGELPDERLGKEGPREVRALAHALIDSAARVRAAARDRELLLAGISHDLRTPLARLRLALELIDGGDADLRRGMEQDMAELDAVLGQFIDFARDGREEGLQSLDLAALAQELASQEWTAPAWAYRGPETCTQRVRPLALRRALANLMRNALRHGKPPFEVRVQVDTERILIGVFDHGAGVSETQLARIDRPFFRGDSNASGSGLGLAVAARVAQQHGGGLHLRNLPSGGFEATLELAPALERVVR
jgi:two-component system osmolarity sensor histidine kinase EnvZ